MALYTTGLTASLNSFEVTIDKKDVGGTSHQSIQQYESEKDYMEAIFINLKSLFSDNTVQKVNSSVNAGLSVTITTSRNGSASVENVIALNNPKCYKDVLALANRALNQPSEGC